MWKIFSKKETDLVKALDSIDKWKSDIFAILEQEVREYFSKKVIVYFDNHMIFQPKRGLHLNLMESLALAEEEMLFSQGVFGRMEMYWVRDEHEHSLVVFGLSDEKEYTLEKHGFNLIQRDAIAVNNQKEKFELNSWKTLIFDIELVNYASGWINYTPSREKRSILQAEYILLNTHMKTQELSLLERINFENNITNHPAYEELYQKVLRIMPKIENSLEQEWKTGNLIIDPPKTSRKKKI